VIYQIKCPYNTLELVIGIVVILTISLGIIFLGKSKKVKYIIFTFLFTLCFLAINKYFSVYSKCMKNRERLEQGFVNITQGRVVKKADGSIYVGKVNFSNKTKYKQHLEPGCWSYVSSLSSRQYLGKYVLVKYVGGSSTEEPCVLSIVEVNATDD
jgi:hypothetical protein